jgi:hypothetical protein
MSDGHALPRLTASMERGLRAFAAIDRKGQTAWLTNKTDPARNWVHKGSADALAKRGLVTLNNADVYLAYTGDLTAEGREWLAKHPEAT